MASKENKTLIWLSFKRSQVKLYILWLPLPSAKIGKPTRKNRFPFFVKTTNSNTRQERLCVSTRNSRTLSTFNHWYFTFFFFNINFNCFTIVFVSPTSSFWSCTLQWWKFLFSVHLYVVQPLLLVNVTKKFVPFKKKLYFVTFHQKNNLGQHLTKRNPLFILNRTIKDNSFTVINKNHWSNWNS